MSCMAGNIVHTLKSCTMQQSDWHALLTALLAYCASAARSQDLEAAASVHSP